MHYFKPWNSAFHCLMWLPLVFPTGICQQRLWCMKSIASVSGHFHKQWKNISSVRNKNYSGRITHFKKSSIMLRKDFANQVFSPSLNLDFFVPWSSLFIQSSLAHWMRHKLPFFFFATVVCYILLCSQVYTLDRSLFPHATWEEVKTWISASLFYGKIGLLRNHFPAGLSTETQALLPWLINSWDLTWICTYLLHDH